MVASIDRQPVFTVEVTYQLPSEGPVLATDTFTMLPNLVKTEKRILQLADVLPLICGLFSVVK